MTTWKDRSISLHRLPQNNVFGAIVVQFWCILSYIRLLALKHSKHFLGDWRLTSFTDGFLITNKNVIKKGRAEGKDRKRRKCTERKQGEQREKKRAAWLIIDQLSIGNWYIWTWPSNSVDVISPRTTYIKRWWVAAVCVLAPTLRHSRNWSLPTFIGSRSSSQSHPQSTDCSEWMSVCLFVQLSSGNYSSAFYLESGSWLTWTNGPVHCSCSALSVLKDNNLCCLACSVYDNHLLISLKSVQILQIAFLYISTI